MLSRRGFLGALTALVAAPRQTKASIHDILPAEKLYLDGLPPVGRLTGTYAWNVTFVDSSGTIETPANFTVTPELLGTRKQLPDLPVPGTPHGLDVRGRLTEWHRRGVGDEVPIPLLLRK